AVLLSSASADLVSAPIATFLMVGGSHRVRCSLLVWPVLLTVMADLRKINHEAFYEITSGLARRRQSRIRGRMLYRTWRQRCDASLSFARVNEEKMLQCAL